MEKVAILFSDHIVVCSWKYMYCTFNSTYKMAEKSIDNLSLFSDLHLKKASTKINIVLYAQ